MVKAADYGIKLLVSIHSYNALDGPSDFYGEWYGTGDFYTSSDAKGYFQDRIAHVLSHVNPNNGKPWSECSEYIFAFEAQNEAMHGQVRTPQPGQPGQRHDSLTETFRRMLPPLRNGNVPWPRPSRTT